MTHVSLPLTSPQSPPPPTPKTYRFHVVVLKKFNSTFFPFYLSCNTFNVLLSVTDHRYFGIWLLPPIAHTKFNFRWIIFKMLTVQGSHSHGHPSLFRTTVSYEGVPIWCPLCILSPKLSPLSCIPSFCQPRVLGSARPLSFSPAVWELGWRRAMQPTCSRVIHPLRMNPSSRMWWDRRHPLPPPDSYCVWGFLGEPTLHTKALCCCLSAPGGCTVSSSLCLQPD